MRQARVGLAKKLQKADRDSNELETLDQQYRDGEIDKAQYQRKKSGLLNLSVTELINIGKGMHAQVIKVPGAPELPPGSAPALPPGSSTPAQLEALLKAIQSGNTVEMQRIVFNPQGGNNDQPVTVSQ